MFTTWEDVPIDDVTSMMVARVEPAIDCYRVHSRTSSGVYTVKQTAQGIACDCHSGRTGWRTKDGGPIKYGCCWHARAAAFVAVAGVGVLLDKKQLYQSISNTEYELE